MGNVQLWRSCFLFCVFSFLLSACANRHSTRSSDYPYSAHYDESKYALMMPQKISMKGKVIIVNPRVYAWGAYQNGNFIRGGIANAGADFCYDEKRPCRTTVGTFRIYSMGDVSCASKMYPIPKGGALMPYCMFFHEGESLHGSPDHILGDSNVSHGCIHMRIPDAEWLRYDFASIGTKVVIQPY